MNTERENNHGEYWADEGIYMRFNMKKLWAWLVSLFLLSGVVQAQQFQLKYNGTDRSASFSVKQTQRNLSTYSEDFSDVSWVKTRTTVTANSITAPDGNLTADTISATAVTNSFLVGKAVTGSPTIGETRRTSAYFKKGTRSFAVLVDDETGNPDHAIRLNIDTCVVIDSQNITRSQTIVSVDNWCRATMEYTVIATVSITTYVNLWDGVAAGLYPSFAGNITDNIYVWGLQHNFVSDPTDYLVTTAAAATFGPLCPAGFSQSLIHPSRCFPLINNRFRSW